MQKIWSYSLGLAIAIMVFAFGNGPNWNALRLNCYFAKIWIVPAEIFFQTGSNFKPVLWFAQSLTICLHVHWDQESLIQDPTHFLPLPDPDADNIDPTMSNPDTHNVCVWNFNGNTLELRNKICYTVYSPLHLYIMCPWDVLVQNKQYPFFKKSQP